jgi:hypothetical protein
LQWYESTIFTHTSNIAHIPANHRHIPHRPLWFELSRHRGTAGILHLATIDLVVDQAGILDNRRRTSSQPLPLAQIDQLVSSVYDKPHNKSLYRPS